MHGWRRAKCHAVCRGAVVRRSVGRSYGSRGHAIIGATNDRRMLTSWIQHKPASVLAASDEHPDLIQSVTWSPRHASPSEKVTSSRKGRPQTNHGTRSGWACSSELSRGNRRGSRRDRISTSQSLRPIASRSSYPRRPGLLLPAESRWVTRQMKP